MKTLDEIKAQNNFIIADTGSDGDCYCLFPVN